MILVETLDISPFENIIGHYEGQDEQIPYL